MRGAGAWWAFVAAALAATLAPACGFMSLDGLTGRDAQAPLSTNQEGDDSGSDADDDGSAEVGADAAIDSVRSDGPSADRTTPPTDGASGGDDGGDAMTGPTVIAHVQNVTQLASGNTLTTTFGHGVAAGDLLVGAFHGEGTVTVSDNRNGAWKQAGNQSGNYVFYVENTTPGHIAITLSATTQGSLRLSADEFSGVATASALDGQSTGSSTGTTWSAGTTMPIAAGELVYGWGGTSESVVLTAGATNGVPMTLGGQATSNSLGTIFSEYALSSAAGAQDSSATVAPAAMKGVNGGQVTFKP
jgi:hypothetical protein